MMVEVQYSNLKVAKLKSEKNNSFNPIVIGAIYIPIILCISL